MNDYVDYLYCGHVVCLKLSQPKTFKANRAMHINPLQDEDKALFLKPGGLITGQIVEEVDGIKTCNQDEQGNIDENYFDFFVNGKVYVFLDKRWLTEEN